MPQATDNCPYWQRQNRTVQGWLNHIASVKAWKRRNVKAHNRHCVTQNHRRKAKYGSSHTCENDLAWIEKAKIWNKEHL